jgi:hypothetical protein
MKQSSSILGAFLMLIVLWASAPAGAAESPDSARNGQHAWIDRPWETRYFLRVEVARYWPAAQRAAAERNGRSGRIISYDVDEILEAGTVVKAPANDFGAQDFVVMAIEFDSNGTVKSGTTQSSLRGRINRLPYLTLAAGDEPNAKTYDLAHWFTGIGDASTHWAPAFCSGHQMPDAAMVKSPMYLYGRLFKADEFSTTFGCREWASQLYDPARRYIDVTSYVPSESSSANLSFVRPFIGWARFGDRKPIIGKHESAWYCFRDCPDGAQPGMIENIAKWATANGWKAPKPPTKTPTFPDPPAVSGRYPQ